ncbi:DUF1292 domain-containing protein [Bacillus sp. PS06]|uniref:DUF1292 domain-containing protein n=1 Tax=Bacillus sp. PS06 TaxID=2764176 RepID=UPI0017838CCB|nr:DUF1292 domain-containing protein [Bacillus sp. PS06]MBD8067971.1 DUF1292 domain-containing protein [Bacillus sp. PS06]
MDKIEVGEVFTITDENENEQEVEVLASMTVSGSDYIAIGFVEDIEVDSEEDVDIFFLKVEDDGEFSYIEDDDEFEKVSNAFESVMDEEE